MLSKLLIFPVILLLTCGEVQGKYILIKMYNSIDCDITTTMSHWLIPVPSLCFPAPFNKYGIFGAADDFVVFSYYGTYNCQHGTWNGSDVYTCGKCYKYDKLKKDVSINITIHDGPLPVNHTIYYGNVAMSNFKDYSCSSPYLVTDRVGTVPFPTNSTMLYKENGTLYCSDCITHNDIPTGLWSARSYPPSFTFRFLSDHQSYVDFYSHVPDVSVAAFFKTFVSFDEHCSGDQSLFFSVSEMDYCNPDTQTITKATDTLWIEMKYLRSDCREDSTYSISFSNSPVGDTLTSGTCLYYGKDGFGQDWYAHLRVETWPTFGKNIAIVTTGNEYPCGSDLTEVKKNLKAMSFIAFSSDRCITEFLFPEIENLLRMKSIRAHCYNGILSGYNYTDTNFCYGTRYVISSDVCYHQKLTNLYYHMSCIPLYCWDVVEYDEDNVCSGRGTCVDKDKCDCEDDYFGEKCEEFNCFGYHKDSDHVCSGNGRCVSPDLCHCKPLNGKNDCSDPVWLYLVISILGATVPFFGFVVCAMCCLGINCLVLSCGVVFSLVIGGSSLIIMQKVRLEKFEKLDDFDLILKEQLLEKDESVAHLKINNLLFMINYDEVDIRKKIGSGGSESTVFLATWKGTRVAFKCFKTKRICENQDKFNQFEAEVNLLANIAHPNIIRFFGATMKPPRVGILMEYCENGEILDYVIMMREKEMRPFPFKEKLRFLREIISAFTYLHSRNIIHRDLKCENVLVDSSMVCKLMDFGISRMVKGTDGENMTKRIGTNVYIAPEIMTGQYDRLCDVFSFSVLLYVLICESDKPYGKSDFQVEFRVAADPTYRPSLEKFEESISTPSSSEKEYEWLTIAMCQCWDHNPSSRFTFEELVGIFENEKVPEELFLEKRKMSEKVLEQKYERQKILTSKEK